MNHPINLDQLFKWDKNPKYRSEKLYSLNQAYHKIPHKKNIWDEGKKDTCKSSSSLINSIASSISSFPRKIPIEIIREWAAAAIASIAANSQSFIFFRRLSMALTRPSSCFPPKKLEYTKGLKPNSDSTQLSKGSIFATCRSGIFNSNESKMNLSLKDKIEWIEKYFYWPPGRCVGVWGFSGAKEREGQNLFFSILVM